MLLRGMRTQGHPLSIESSGQAGTDANGRLRSSPSAGSVSSALVGVDEASLKEQVQGRWRSKQASVSQSVQARVVSEMHFLVRGFLWVMVEVVTAEFQKRFSLL